MQQQTSNRWMCFVAGLALLAAVPAARAENLPAARFRGAPTYDLLVTNVHWEAGTEEYSFVTFDLSWGHSWRAKWVEPAATSVTGKDLEVESWDAAWVFVKFLPDKENRNSIERNHWQHAALDPDPRQHVMPAGATNSVRLFDGGSQGMGVFIYRDALGYGPNNFKGIKLRWRHGAVAGQKIDPAKAGLRVYPISMVYIPEGPFKVGSGADSGFTKFPDGPTVPIANGDYMGAMNVGLGSRTDGSWRGGPVVPFLVDAEWNGPVVEGTRGRRVGSKAGQLWSVLTFAEYWVDRPSVGSTGFLNDDYPTGYEAFYGMKYDITQGQYVDFVNSLPPDVAAGRAFLSDEIGCDYPLGEGDVKIKLDLGPEYKPYFYNERAGLTITVSTRTEECRGKGVLKPKELEVGQVSTEPTASGDLLDNALGETDRQAEAAKQKKLVKVPPVYAARLPFRACSGISRHDLYAYAVWAGLRPMTELESGKAGQGPRNPGACENNTVTNHGTAADNWAAAAASLKDLVDVGLPTERFARGNHAGGYGSPLTVFRVGCFATPTSDQVAAGASYWGLLELGAGPRVISLLNRDYQGTHGDGTTPAGKPGGSTGRGMAPFDAPPDWPTRTWEYYSGRWVWNRGRLVISAGNRTKKTAPQPAPAMAKPSPASGAPSAAAATAGRVADALTIANLKWAPGTKDYSTISFDLAWNNSWRTTWTEPADKNVTGKPLRLANWDAAWVFIKFRPTVTNALLHATVSPEAEDHRVPTDAKLDVGLSDDGSKGVGVFIYRSADGSGANNFKNIKLRWLHGAGQVPDQATFKDSQLRAYAIGMVYVPGGQFQSRVPWEQTVTTIRLGDATKQGGCRVLTNTPVYAECPNGYNAFYSTKYAISQGQYADYLNAQGPARGGPGLYGVSRYMIRCDTNAGVYVAEVPDRGCNFLGWPQILNYEAWAGLRPLTDLEYEKACRGPRAVARAEDAWAAGICAPAAGLSKELFPGLPDIDAGASYWGIRGLSLSGCVHEWPGIIFENERGKGFKGTHGEGQPVLPKDWPGTCSLHVRDAPFPAGAVATWVSPDDIDRVVTLGENLVFMYTGRYGARAVRTAPSVADASSPLQLDRLADLRAVDLALLPLAGSFRNDGDQPLQVELDTPLPEAAFLDGAASRRFTAAPRAVAPFKIRLLLTREAFLRAAQGGQTMPVRVRLCGSGDVLAEQAFDPRFQVNPVPEQLPVIGPLTDGEVPLRLTNLTERPLPLTVTLLPPADFVISGAAEQRVELAANAAGRVAFSAPRQTPTNEGVCRIPYRVVAAGGTALEGAAVVQQRLASRWWISRKVHTGPAGGGDGMDALDNAPGMADLTNYDSAIFKAATPPKNWASATYGASLAFGSAGNLPSQGSTIQAATRVVPPAERQALLDVPYGGKGAVQLEIIVWVNDTIVFKLDANRKTEAKPFLLRKSGNTLLVECRSADNAAGSLGYMGLSFRDAKSGAPLYGLVFDIEKP